jgi:hypothetical protein
MGQHRRGSGRLLGPRDEAQGQGVNCVQGLHCRACGIVGAGLIRVTEALSPPLTKGEQWAVLQKGGRLADDQGGTSSLSPHPTASLIGWNPTRNPVHSTGEHLGFSG